MGWVWRGKSEGRDGEEVEVSCGSGGFVTWKHNFVKEVAAEAPGEDDAEELTEGVTREA